MKNFDWNEIAFTNKSDLKKQNYIFISGFRDISTKRLLAIIKDNIPKSNILVGILKEEYIDGFETQAHFKSMKKEKVELLLQKLASVKLPNNIDTIEYFQRDIVSILEKIKPQKVIFINGSWSKSFHLRAEYYALSKNKINYKLISPFDSEKEAIEYSLKIKAEFAQKAKFVKTKKYTDSEIYEFITLEAKKSFATDYQTACALVDKSKILMLAHNEVLPFETYAFHYGSTKEKNFTPPNDLNHYDTIHAEMRLLIKAMKNNINLKNKSLYINLLPCPTCAKSLSLCGLKQVVYTQDHSEGYALKLFKKAGIKTKRFIP